MRLTAFWAFNLNMDIDSSSFDAKRYVTAILQQNSIRELVRRNNQIDEEVKVHDHEIQSLVFENYSKFISSIDTVRDMKDNICAVDDKLKVLQNSMDHISTLAFKIDSTFAVKRRQIQKLDTINRDLQKLKNLCDFPNVLQQDIKFFKSLPEARIASEIEGLFHKSISFYQNCYKTLVSLKEEPLITPIYKESVDKVETIRSTLKALQAQFNKNKMHSNILRNVTKKLLVITDDQVSVLRIYLHSWKERFGESCFKSQKKYQQLEPNRRLADSHSQFPQINEELWKEFQTEFAFIFEELYPLLTLTPDEIQLHISHYGKELFSWGLSHYQEALPQHCNSLKTFVHIHHMISGSIVKALVRIEAVKGQQKVASELRQKMDEKFQVIGMSMLNFIFGRVKIYFLQEVIEVKKTCSLINVSEESLKEGYIKALTPLKENVTSNFKSILDDMEHFKNIHELVFKRKEQYQEVVHRQIENFLKFLALAACKGSIMASQQLCSSINTNYSSKLHRSQKNTIEAIVKEFACTQESGCWFVSAHHFLSSLSNNFAKKIIESTQKNVEVPKNHNYGQLFTYIKTCLGSNTLSAANHYCRLLTSTPSFEKQLPSIQDFVDVLNIIFIDSRRAIMKKPSFLKDNVSVHQTQILAIKKLHLIEKKFPSDRNGVLLYFIRKGLKNILGRTRCERSSGDGTGCEGLDVYCFCQLCYQLINVEEEGQIVAFYELILHQKREKVDQLLAQERYMEIRKLLRDSSK